MSFLPASYEIHGEHRFSKIVEDSIREVASSDSPFDAPHFDPIEFINQHFPDANSFSSLEVYVDDLRKEIETTKAEIYSAVQRQSSNRSSAQESLESAKSVMRELGTKIHEIREKAERSESMVQEICKDIKNLDIAKKNLTTSIKSLRKVFDFETDLIKIQESYPRERYRETALQFQACKDFSNDFSAYFDVPKIRTLQEMFRRLTTSVSEHVVSTFREKFFVSSEDSVPPVVAEAVELMSVLGPSVWTDIRKWICDEFVQSYQVHFLPEKDHSSFQNLDRRYFWLRRQVQNYLKRSNFFPIEWKVLQEMCVEFCLATREIISNMLRDLESHLDIKALLLGLRRTCETEDYLTQLFSSKEYLNVPDYQFRTSNDADSESDESDSGSDDGDRKRLRKNAAKMRKKYFEKVDEPTESTTSCSIAVDADPDPDSAISNRITFRGLISSCFQDYMYLYVENEDRELADAYRSSVLSETWIPKNADRSSGFQSSLSLFFAIQKSFKNASRFTRGTTVIELGRVYGKFLSMYKQTLESLLPQPVQRESSFTAKFTDAFRGSSSKKQKEVVYEANDEELVRLCNICNTSEYCNETIGSLKDSLHKYLDDDQKLLITFSDVTEGFSSLIVQSLRIAVSVVISRADETLESMTRISWDSVDSLVGDASDYVRGISSIFWSSVPVIMSTLSNKYRRFFCDKLVTSWGPRVTASVFKCKRISEDGAQQLLIDVQSLKQIASEVPKMVDTGKGSAIPASSIPSSFRKIVDREFERPIAVLQFLISPVEQMVMAFHQFFPQSTSEAEFLQLLEIKGLKKNETTRYLEEFRSRMPQWLEQIGSSSS